jgi:hypothetical protein
MIVAICMAGPIAHSSSARHRGEDPAWLITTSASACSARQNACVAIWQGKMRSLV